MKKILLGLPLILLSGCTLPLLLGHIGFNDFGQAYEFNFSKETLKDKIVEQYTYDVGLLSKNLGRTLIENPEVNRKYRVSTTEWLDKKSWEKYKAEIRQSLTDTTDILIAKHHSRKSIHLRLIIDGDEKASRLRIVNVTAHRRREFEKPLEFYRDKLTKKIKNRFVERIN